MKRSSEKLAAEAPIMRAPLPAMVTYAQNFEDVILRRALCDIDEGFYIDLGAYEPIADSVTYWFYQNGWRGVNVEPNPELFPKLCAARPHDTNLEVVVAGHPGTVALHLQTGLSTIVPAIAANHARTGLDMSRTIEREAITLDGLFAEHVGSRTVDFLKIDIEGSEGEVLGATRFETVRPRILVVEATEPNSTAPAWRGWEPGLLKKGYIHVWFDGLNRFYLREEDRWRAQFFTSPVNGFDNYFFPLSHGRVENGNSTLAELHRLRDERDRLDDANGRIERERDERAAALEQLAAETFDLRVKDRERDAALLAAKTVAEAAETSLMAARAELETHRALIAEAEEFRLAAAHARQEASERGVSLGAALDEAARLRALVDEREVGFTAAEDRAQTAEDEVRQLRALVGEQGAAIASAENRVRSGEEILSIALTELVALRDEEAERGARLSDAKGEVAFFQKLLGERDCEITAAGDRVRAAEAGLVRARREIAAQRTKLAEAARQRAEIIQTGERLRTECQTSQREVAWMRQLWCHLLMAISAELAPHAEANRKGDAFYALFRRGRARRSRMQGNRARDAKQWSVAARCYRQSLEKDPLDTPIWVQYGHALKECGRLSDAEAAYRQALAREPAAADTHLQIGHVLKLQGRMDEAQGAYLCAFALDPSRPHSVQELARFGWQPSELSQFKTLCVTLRISRDNPTPSQGADIRVRAAAGAEPGPGAGRSPVDGCGSGPMNVDGRSGRDARTLEVGPALARVSAGE